MPGYSELKTRFCRDLLAFLNSRPDVDLEDIDHATPEMPFDLGTARDNKRIHSRSGDRIFITELTGVAYIRTRLKGAKYKLFLGNISLPFKNLFLTNTAQAGKTLSLIIGYGAYVDFAVKYLAVKILNIANTEINPSTEEKQDATIAQLDIKLSALRDAICDSAAPKDLKDIYDQLYAMRGSATPKSLKQIWDVLTTISGLDFATDTGLAVIAGLDFATQTTLEFIKLATDNLDTALSTRASEDTLALVKAKTDNLDVALSTRAKEAGGNLAAIAGKDFATQTTLALIKAKTDNLDLAITDLRDAICDTVNPKDLFDLYTRLNVIAGLDFAEQTTLALIKAKTDNLNLTITALRDAICDSGANAKTLKALWDKLSGIEGLNTDIEQWTEYLKLNSLRMSGSFTTPYNVTMTNLDTQYTQALPNGTQILTFFVRGGGVAYRYAWVTGKVAAPTAPYIEVPSNGIVCLDKIFTTSKTLYFACSTAGKIMQIEAIG